MNFAPLAAGNLLTGKPAEGRRISWSGWTRCYSCGGRYELSLFEPYQLPQAMCPKCGARDLREAGPPATTTYTRHDWSEVITPPEAKRTPRLPPRLPQAKHRSITVRPKGDAFIVSYWSGDYLDERRTFKEALLRAHEIATEKDMPVYIHPSIYASYPHHKRRQRDPRERPNAPMFPVDSWICAGWYPEGREILPKPVLQFDYFGEAA